MADETRASDPGVESVLAGLYEELRLADHIYGLARDMKRELDGVTGEPDGDSVAAARLMRMEHEAAQSLRRAVETETRLMAALSGEDEENPPAGSEAPTSESQTPAGDPPRQTAE